MNGTIKMWVRVECDPDSEYRCRVLGTPLVRACAFYSHYKELLACEHAFDNGVCCNAYARSAADQLAKQIEASGLLAYVADLEGDVK